MMERIEVLPRVLARHVPTGQLYAGVAPAMARRDMAPVHAMTLRRGDVIHTVSGPSTVHATIDFETYSEAGFVLRDGDVKGIGSQGTGGIGAVGAAAYAEHPSTTVLTIAYDLKDGTGPHLWQHGDPAPLHLFDAIAAGALLEAHNSLFEYFIWNMVCARRMGWPELPLGQLRCSMAKARRFSVPGSLAGASKALGTSGKDDTGSTIMKRLSRPHKWTKTRQHYAITRADDPEKHAALAAYNVQDVVAESEVSALVPDLSPFEEQVWLVDQRINARGVLIDVTALRSALAILQQAVAVYHSELAALTLGAVTSPSEVAKLCAWGATRGVYIENLQDETVDTLLSREDLPGDVRRALEIRQAMSSAGVKKLATFQRLINSDGRLRDQYAYCGADRTGRWSAPGAQLQNITAAGPAFARCEDMTCNKYFGLHAGTPKNAAGETCCPRCGSAFWVKGKDWGVDQAEQAIEDLQQGDLRRIEYVWGPVAQTICGTLRGLLRAKPGHVLVCCDFSAIEAVVAACLSGCQWRIDVFSTPGSCIYTMSASKITGTPVEVYKQYKKDNGVDHPDRKKIGKVAELASGFGGGVGAWLNFGAAMPEPEIKEAIKQWRKASPEIVEMWGGQYRNGRAELYGLEGAAISAIRQPGVTFGHKGITYTVQDGILLCRLLSGRVLHYHAPRLVPDTRWGEGRVKIVFEGYNSNAAKGPVGWIVQETYGGRLFENVVQATARDLQAHALVNVDAAGFPIVMHTHDEIAAEVPEGHPVLNLETMRGLMTRPPEWAAGWPIRAAGWTGVRYRKD